MSHELETVNGRVSFAYNINNGNPWHRLGTPMEGLQGLEAMLEASGTGFEVERLSLSAYGEQGFTPVTSHVATGRLNQEEGVGYDILGVVTAGYHIVQNRDAAQFALDIVAAGDKPVIDTMGSMMDGKRFFSYIRLDDLHVGPDVIATGIGVLTSHDGSMALTAALSNVRWVCNNTVTAGLNRAQATVKIKHTASIGERMAGARDALGIMVDQQAEFEHRVRRLQSEVFLTSEFEKLVRTIWKREDDEKQRAKTTRDRREAKLLELWRSDKNSGLVGPTKWAAYNTLVEYADHFQSGVSVQRRVEKAVSPEPNKVKDQAYDLLAVK